MAVVTILWLLAITAALWLARWLLRWHLNRRLRREIARRLAALNPDDLRAPAVAGGMTTAEALRGAEQAAEALRKYGKRAGSA